MVFNGCYSLIRWSLAGGLVIHGGVDGFSRMIVFLRFTNNRTETVANLFQLAISEYGTPCNITTDNGGENVRLSEKWRTSG